MWKIKCTEEWYYDRMGKGTKGYLYDANYDKEIIEARTRCADLCYEFNNLRPSDTEKQQELLKKILGKMEGMPVVTAPFYCDYGINISIGRNFYTNHNVTILDCAKVTFGDNVLLHQTVCFPLQVMPSTVNREVGGWRSHRRLQWVMMYGSEPMYLCCQV